MPGPSPSSRRIREQYRSRREGYSVHAPSRMPRASPGSRRLPEVLDAITESLLNHSRFLSHRSRSSRIVLFSHFMDVFIFYCIFFTEIGSQDRIERSIGKDEARE
eukprot:scaffold142_cov233-Pinguiococcus_pyrenoidosus.AAC.1